MIFVKKKLPTCSVVIFTCMYGIFFKSFLSDEKITPSGGKMSNLTVKALGVKTVLYGCTASNKAGTSMKFTSYITVIEKGKHTPLKYLFWEYAIF